MAYAGRRIGLVKTVRGVSIKRQGLHLAFSPNLTMNLTYLCYGDSKIGASGKSEKPFGQTSLNSVEMRLLSGLPTNNERQCLPGKESFGISPGKLCPGFDKIKKVEVTPPFLPQILP